MSNNINEEQVKEALESGYGKSEALLNNKDELDDFLSIGAKNNRNAISRRRICCYPDYDFFD